jgi:hypothetical protein
MSLILNGTDGLSDVDGTAATPAIRGTDANTGIFFPAADTIAFSEGGTEAMRIDSAGNLGLGTTSPTVKFNVQGTSSTALTLARFSNASTASVTTKTAVMALQIADTEGTIKDVALLTGFPNGVNAEQGGLAFSTRGTGEAVAERMRISSNGVLSIGETESSGNPRLRIRNNALTSTTRTVNNLIALATNGNGADGCISITDSVANNVWFGQNNGGGYFVCNVNGVRLPSGATAWVSDSDERFKDIIEPITNALDKVSTLRTVIGKYKTEEDARRSFLIAQDVQAVFPEAVYAQKDEDETLGVAYTDLIPLMIASIKELNAKVDAQSTTIQELKATVDAQAARIAALENPPVES